MKVTKQQITDTLLPGDQVGIWYLGQEGFLFKGADQYLVTDPYLSDYVDRNCCRPGVNWQRMYQPPVAASELDFLDVVVCTHAHYDHADPDTLSQLAKNNPKTKFVVPAPEADSIAACGIEKDRILPAVAWEPVCIGAFTIIPVPSAHEELLTDEQGRYYALGYIIRTAGKTFFHAGDMCMYDGLIENVRPYSVDIAFLPINGKDYFRTRDDIIGNFNCEEAVLLAKKIGADMLVPMHHDLYAINRVRPAHFVDAVETLDPYRKYHIFAPGELYIKG